jgi:hypothetical protein
MITKEEFIKFIKSYQTFVSGTDRLFEALTGSKYNNVFETDWGNAVGQMLDTFIESHFTEVGADYVFWWLFEEVDHKIWRTVDPDLFNGKSVIEYDVNDIEDLWKYLIKFKKDYFKDAE